MKEYTLTYIFSGLQYLGLGRLRALSLCNDVVPGHFALLNADLSIGNLKLTNKHYISFKNALF